MQVVKPNTHESWCILEQFFPGRADFLMQKTEHDRMEAVATYLAQQIKVKIDHPKRLSKFLKIILLFIRLL